MNRKKIFNVGGIMQGAPNLMEATPAGILLVAVC